MGSGACDGTWQSRQQRTRGGDEQRGREVGYCHQDAAGRRCPSPVPRSRCRPARPRRACPSACNWWVVASRTGGCSASPRRWNRCWRNFGRIAGHQSHNNINTPGLIRARQFASRACGSRECRQAPQFHERGSHVPAVSSTIGSCHRRVGVRSIGLRGRQWRTSDVAAAPAAPETAGSSPTPVPPQTGGTTTGLAITDIVVENTASAEQLDTPLTFGQVFAVGAMSATARLSGVRDDGTAVPLQMDVKATHADGSVRHAVLSAVLPRLAPGESAPPGADHRRRSQQRRAPDRAGAGGRRLQGGRHHQPRRTDLQRLCR